MPVDTYQLCAGTHELGIVGTVAPGLFAQEGRCWRMVYDNPVGRGGHGSELVAWVGPLEVSRWLDEGLELRAGHGRTGRCFGGLSENHSPVSLRPSCHVVVRFDLYPCSGTQTLARSCDGRGSPL